MDWTDENYSNAMIASSGEVADRVFKKLVGKSGKIWMVAMQDNPADNIYVSGGKHSQGMAGRTLEFKHADGSATNIQGPWHTNADALFRDTDYDVRHMCLTFGCIGLSREYGKGPGLGPVTIHDVLHVDACWTLGEYERIDKIAQAIANERGVTVVRFIKSKGGSCCGPVKPKTAEVQSS